MACTLRDVTESKKTDEALKKSERTYRALFNTVRDGFASVTMDKRIVEANPAYLAMLGYTEDHRSMTYDDLTPRKWHGVQEKIVQDQVLTRGYSDVYLKEYVRKDGTVFPVEIRTHLLKDDEGRPTGMWSFFRDVTARVNAEEALRQSEERFATVFRAGPMGASLTRLVDGKFLDVNDAFLRLLGYERDEVIGRDPLSLGIWVNADDRARMVDTLRSGGRVTGLETTFRTKTGETSEVLIAAEFVDAAGERYILGLTRDITGRKRLEEQLRQAQKMEAVGTLAGGVAHDFNNILTVIMGLGNLMQMSLDRDDIHRAHVDQIVASSERAADLTRSLLAFSRKQRIALEAHKVNGVVTSTAKLLMRLLPEDIKLTMNLTDKDTSSLLDVTQIGQVLMNLATNARDAMPHGGSLAITTERTKIDEVFRATQGFGRTGEYMRIAVSDTGTGMDEPTMKRIFEPFFTTKEVGKGTGLGLASAYGIVKQHNGYITSRAAFRGDHLRYFSSPRRDAVSARSSENRDGSRGQRDDPHRRRRPGREKHAYQDPRQPGLHHHRSHRRRRCDRSL